MSRPACSGATAGAWQPAHPRSGRALRRLLGQLLLLLCAAAAIAAFGLTLMLPGMYSPQRVNAAPLPRVLLVPSSRVHVTESGPATSWELAYCQTRQAAFMC